MPQTAGQESIYWLAAGVTMFQFLGIGLVLWVFCGLVRLAFRPAPPQVRYAVALGLLLTAAAVPAGLFVTAVHRVSERTAQSDLSSRGSSLKTTVNHRTGSAEQHAGDVRVIQPPIRTGAISISESKATSGDWKSALNGGFHVVRNVACRWLPWVWLMGTPSILIVLACGVNGADRLRRGGRLLVEGDVVAVHQRLRAVLRVGRQVAIVACDRVSTPILVGILRPAILLPSAVLTGFSPEQIEMILVHELAHVRRWDNLVNLIQRVIEAALFFHPVVWWLSSWVRLEREECCDRIVVTHTRNAQGYAETLAALSLPGITPRHAAAAMADCHLVTRIRHILNLEDEVMTVSRTGFVAVAGVLIFVGCFAASFAQERRDAPSNAAEKPRTGATAGPSAPVSTESANTNVEALQQAISAGQLQEVASGVVIDYDVDGLVSNAHGAGLIQVLLNQSPATAGWVFSTTNSQGGACQKWGPEQATGAPNSPDDPNNQGTAWCPATADGQEEWLELTYGEPVEPLALVVYECLKPGALTRVLAYDAEGNELNAWSGKDPSPPDSGNGSAISVVPLKLKKIKIVRVRLFLDSPHVEGWNEIDAVGILDVKGTVHWATAATASSTWVDQTAATTTNSLTVQYGIQWLGSTGNIAHLRGDAVDPARTGLVGVIPAQSAPVHPANVNPVASSLVRDLNSGWADIVITAQPQGNPAGSSDAERAALFEERIKKLEAEIAGLRKVLQQFKPPAGEKTNTPAK